LEYAIKDFKQALKLQPKHHNASKYLKETLFEKGLRYVVDILYRLNEMARAVSMQ
jgi:hypothetical protein